MTDTNQDAAVPSTATAGSVTVYRAQGATWQSQGICEVQSGALVVTGANGQTLAVFGPGQWISVNVAPL